MNLPFPIVIFGIALVWLSLMVTAHGQAEVPKTSRSTSPKDLQALVDRAVQTTLAEFADKKLESNQFAITLVDLHDLTHPVQANYRGEAQIYPASVVKLFYLVAAHQEMADGKVQDTPEFRRALHDMIVYSYNEATSYVVDVLTGTTSGPELPPAELEQWNDKRNAVNRYFTSLGYTNINANKKPWGEGPYGRETQAIKAFQPTRNLLTTDAAARLLTEIVTGKAISADHSQQMMTLLKRDFANPNDNNYQAREFTGRGLPASAKLWSKAGDTSTTRHDAAYVELANGARFVLVTFTVDHSQDQDIIPSVARVIADGMGATE